MSNNQLLHCRVSDCTLKMKFIVSCVYGETNTRDRRPLWDSLKDLAGMVSEPWLVLGDFNAFLSQQDKVGGASPDLTSIQEFRECILDTSY